MPDRPDRPRIGRKGNRKVRTGCRTCKIRKVKCDETKPFCLRCTSSGRVCDGYAPVPPRARRTVPIVEDATDPDQPSTSTSSDSPIRTERSTFNFADASSSASSALTTTSALSPSSSSFSLAFPSSAALSVRLTGFGLSSPSPSLILGDSNGALTLFHRRTAPKLASYSDSYFWNELLLQLGDIEPAVRHALAAVNSIYDYCEGRGGAAPPEPEALRLQHPAYAHGLREYNKSIGALVHRQNTRGGDLSVHLAAMDHFDQGLKLLSSYTGGASSFESRQIEDITDEDMPKPESPSSSPTRQREGAPAASILTSQDIVRETIAPVFRRLSLQAIMLGRDTPMIPLFDQIYPSQDIRNNAPFTSIQQASQALVAIMDNGLRLAHDIIGLDHTSHGLKYDREKWEAVGDLVQRRRHEVHEDLNRWLDNFSPWAATWVTTSLKSDPKSRLGCLLMRVQHLISKIWVSSIAEPEEMAFDRHVADFSSAIHFASDILLMQKASPDPSNDTVFTFDMGVIAPLYFVCTKCRQRRIRRSSLHLLANWPRRENVWDPEQIARVARRYIELEDPRALDDDAPDNEVVPEGRRIYKVDFEYTKDADGNSLTVALFQRKPFGMDSEWEVIREVIPGVSDGPDTLFTSQRNSF